MVVSSASMSRLLVNSLSACILDHVSSGKLVSCLDCLYLASQKACTTNIP
jgi:hypothetical protein